MTQQQRVKGRAAEWKMKRDSLLTASDMLKVLGIEPRSQYGRQQAVDKIHLLGLTACPGLDPASPRSELFLQKLGLLQSTGAGVEQRGLCTLRPLMQQQQGPQQQQAGGRKGVLEIKCPVSKALASDSHWQYLVQIQALMEITDLDWAHLWVYKPEEGALLVTIPRDRRFWDRILPLLASFHLGHVLPAKQQLLLLAQTQKTPQATPQQQQQQQQQGKQQQDGSSSTQQHTSGTGGSQTTPHQPQPPTARLPYRTAPSQQQQQQQPSTAAATPAPSHLRPEQQHPPASEPPGPASAQTHRTTAAAAAAATSSPVASCREDVHTAAASRFTPARVILPLESERRAQRPSPGHPPLLPTTPLPATAPPTSHRPTRHDPAWAAGLASLVVDPWQGWRERWRRGPRRCCGWRRRSGGRGRRAWGRCRTRRGCGKAWTRAGRSPAVTQARGGSGIARFSARHSLTKRSCTQCATRSSPSTAFGQGAPTGVGGASLVAPFVPLPKLQETQELEAWLQRMYEEAAKAQFTAEECAEWKLCGDHHGKLPCLLVKATIRHPA
ncbi:MAG: hypothetical protein WDW38_007163 [Sanguina aurantia]